jgi:enoyl-CoA hydratase
MIDVWNEGALWTLSLNRPEKANALTHEMLEGIVVAIAKAQALDARVLILTGRGKVFSAGADLDAARLGLATDPIWQRVSAAVSGFPGLSIAALNGTLAGGAMGMALACDLRIAVPGARFFYPVMKLGYLPQQPDPARLVALLGPARAKMILMAGAKIDADEALAWGLIDRIIPAERLIEAVNALAADALAAPSGHAAAIKAML